MNSPFDKQIGRWLLFIALALPIYLGVLNYEKRQQKAYRQKTGETQASQASPTPTGAATPDARASDPAETIEPAEPAATGAPLLERPKDVPTIEIKTRSLRVLFSPAGGAPVLWQIIDPRYLNADAAAKELEIVAAAEPPTEADGEGAASEGVADEGAAGEGAAGEGEKKKKPAPGRPVDLIDPKLDPGGLPRPFEIVLKERNSRRFYNELNNAVYETAAVEHADGYHTIRFVSPATESGLQVVKTFQIPDEGFLARFKIELRNVGSSRLEFDNQGTGLGLALGPGLGPLPMEFRNPEQGQRARRLMGNNYLTLDALYLSSQGVKAVGQRKPGQDAILKDEQGGKLQWGGIEDRYFFMALIPQKTADETASFDRGVARVDPQVASTGFASSDQLRFYPRLELYGKPFRLEPGETIEASYDVFSGPKERRVLEGADHDLIRLLFHNSMKITRGLCFMLMSMLDAFHRMVKSWGVAIILLVITLRIIILPLTHYQLRSQAKMMAVQAKLKPDLDRINEKYKTDPQKRTQETMKLYREKNFNPFGMLKGCLPLLIQLPIFFALFRILGSDYALRGASFLWINDLSEPDRLFPLGFSIPLLGWTDLNLLPIFVTATQVVMSKLSFNPAAISDPTQAAMQKQMMYMMPVMIFVMTYTFPAGLALYWFISNLWSVAQQQFVNKKILKPATAAS